MPWNPSDPSFSPIPDRNQVQLLGSSVSPAFLTAACVNYLWPRVNSLANPRAMKYLVHATSLSVMSLSRYRSAKTSKGTPHRAQ